MWSIALNYSKVSDLGPGLKSAPPTWLLKLVLTVRLLNIINAVLYILLGSGIYFEIVFIVRWS